MKTGTTVIYFPKSNVIHLGDVYVNGLYPLIDLGSGGTIDGYFLTINHALSLINDHTKVIPGHGDIATKKDLYGSPRHAHDHPRPGEGLDLAGQVS
jgi:cyclase